MKVKIIALKIAFLMVVSTSMAFSVFNFSSWQALTQSSPDIIIAQCTKTPDPFNLKTTNGISIDPDGLIDSDIEVISILKGATNWGVEKLKAPSFGTARMSSQYLPRQGEYYLIFSIYYYGKYQANEDYRIVPLGTHFLTNMISGKNLDEKIQGLLQRRLDDLNRQMKDEQKEKQRLEQGVKKP